jgi:hypothetical protein
LNLRTKPGYSSPTSITIRSKSRREVASLPRLRYLFLLVVALVLVTAPLLQGKGAPIDLLIQSTTDVYGELAPCG